MSLNPPVRIVYRFVARVITSSLKELCRTLFYSLGLTLVLFGSHSLYAAITHDVEFARLLDEFGDTLPTGAGVKVIQVEAAQGRSSLPNSFHHELHSKVIRDFSSSSAKGISGHATSVGVRFYGSDSSYSPGVLDVEAYDVQSWLSDFHSVGSPLGLYSRPTDRQVVNHSWVGTGLDDGSGYSSAERTSAVLRLSDWFSATDEVVQVFGSTNNDDYPRDNSKALMMSSFNGITAGVSDYSHGYRTKPLDDLYVAGRAAIHIVVPVPVTSLAAADIASAATLLIDAGKQNPGLSESSTRNRKGDRILNAERPEVVKALLMAGAERETRNTTAMGDIVDYRQALAHRTSNGLDWRYGAGQLNLYQSYRILLSGECASIEDGGGEQYWLLWI